MHTFVRNTLSGYSEWTAVPSLVGSSGVAVARTFPVRARRSARNCHLGGSATAAARRVPVRPETRPDYSPRALHSRRLLVSR